MTYVYWIHLPYSNILSDGYVGVTNNPERRWKEHKTKNKTAIVHKAIKKYDELVYEIMWQGSEEDALELEEYLRPTEKIGWNLTAGGGKPPIMTKEAAAKAVTTRKRNNYKISEETRKKIGKANARPRKIPKTDEYIFKHEVKDKVIRVFYNSSLDLTEYLTTWELFKKYNLNKSHAYAIVRGDRKTHKNWTYKGEHNDNNKRATK